MCTKTHVTIEYANSFLSIIQMLFKLDSINEGESNSLLWFTKVHGNLSLHFKTVSAVTDRNHKAGLQMDFQGAGMELEACPGGCEGIGKKALQVGKGWAGFLWGCWSGEGTLCLYPLAYIFGMYFSI